MSVTPTQVAFIGSAGIPNRYGGFESFLGYCAPALVRLGIATSVTCDARLYEERSPIFDGVNRIFLPVRANGSASILHDLLAFCAVLRGHSHIIVLGVSGGIWFAAFRLVCDLLGKRLYVNIDGVEWRRSKFSLGKRLMLRVFDAMAQWFAHGIVYDNDALRPYVLRSCLSKARMIAYAGDHCLQTNPAPSCREDHALTICRIEPENQIELLIEGALASRLTRYTLVGNWQASAYGRRLRSLHAGNTRLQLLDPVYDATALAALRQSHGVYLHGHSVGGTNPSLVEMLFYPVHLLCFDCAFNRATAGEHAHYFSDVAMLAKTIDNTLTQPVPPAPKPQRYTTEAVAAAYVEMCRD